MWGRGGAQLPQKKEKLTSCPPQKKKKTDLLPIFRYVYKLADTG